MNELFEGADATNVSVDDNSLKCPEPIKAPSRREFFEDAAPHDLRSSIGMSNPCGGMSWNNAVFARSFIHAQWGSRH